MRPHPAQIHRREPGGLRVTDMTEERETAGPSPFFSVGFGGLTEEKLCAYGGQMFRIFFKRPGAAPDFCKKFGRFLLRTGKKRGRRRGERAKFDTGLGIFILTAAGRPGIISDVWRDWDALHESRRCGSCNLRGGSLTLHSAERGAPRSPFSLRENEDPCPRMGLHPDLT